MTDSSSAPDPDEKGTKEMRLEHPSGFLYLTRHESIPIIIDALLDLPPDCEFNKTELADHAGVTTQTVANHTALLLELKIIEVVPNATPTRYRVPESPVVKELLELNSALNAVTD